MFVEMEGLSVMILMIRGYRDRLRSHDEVVKLLNSAVLTKTQYLIQELKNTPTFLQNRQCLKTAPKWKTKIGYKQSIVN